MKMLNINEMKLNEMNRNEKSSKTPLNDEKVALKGNDETFKTSNRMKTI